MDIQKIARRKLTVFVFQLSWHERIAQVRYEHCNQLIRLLTTGRSGTLMKKESSLSGEQIRDMVNAKLDAYKELGVSEQYAMFMGKAQLLEFGLKGLLSRKYDVPEEDMERWTLGRTKNELRERNLRPDFIALLESVVDYRNYMAHELLVNGAITKSLADFSPRKLYGDLFRGIYELEQLLILYDWCEENNGW